MLYGLMSTAALAAIAVGAGTPGAAPAATVRAASGGPERVTIVATEYKFQAPDSIRAGVVDLHLVNHGKLPHQAWLVRIEGGKTLKDVVQAVSGEKWPPWVVGVGGPNVAMPGGEADATVLLTPGEYAIVCVIPNAKGVPHVALGMHRELRVTGPAPAASVALPAADDTVGLTNYSFLPSHPLTAGHHRLLFVNRADQTHEAVFVRLAPGKTPQEFTAWVLKQVGPPPGVLVGGGTAGLAPGREIEGEIDLTPGHYGLMCFIPDKKDGKPHFMHGMITEFTIH